MTESDVRDHQHVLISIQLHVSFAHSLLTTYPIKPLHCVFRTYIPKHDIWILPLLTPSMQGSASSESHKEKGRWAGYIYIIIGPPTIRPCTPPPPPSFDIDSCLQNSLVISCTR
ncbi:unnamed protein product [Periconia digitata]|uniref:Uncharacterized protein n=1 Tax=Periconia digitata TaxID=1303443 RepID=A0A9W4UN09_9PLEO|nr:unnamed protein product [Periconia digitata]